MSSRIARQAIFDRQHNVVAYELLFREGKSDCFPCVPSRYATQSVLEILFSQGLQPISLTDNKPVFINFGFESLVDGTALQYPKDSLIVEVLEDCEPNAALFSALTTLKSHGYKIAFDDFVPSERWLSFIPLADIIKIDFQQLSFREIEAFVSQYRHAFSFQLLAEKIETQAECEFALALGFDLFQGYQFSKPERLEHAEAIKVA
ncbi:EAL domain-containing protein [Enterovibrio sp. ZSDZ35]|uniref:EAL domain-containing protein n=1 Tax=Enterovibrio qingdaonensis TaxID=2899818 RepID=A0ABT5QQ25_9GAMM|nr:EAL domain-containing protein [Enterovibrio sp. ZSDZ35]MDD1783088.1 EAL domain-containing protein [Enterovibrio sp. ZSDZ35]